MSVEICGNLAAVFLHILLDGVAGALAHLGAVRQVHAAHAGLGRELQEAGALGLHAVIAEAAGQLQSGLALRGVIVETGEGRAADQIAAAGALHREEVGG